MSAKECEPVKKPEDTRQPSEDELCKFLIFATLVN